MSILKCGNEQGQQKFQENHTTIVQINTFVKIGPKTTLKVGTVSDKVS